MPIPDALHDLRSHIERYVGVSNAASLPGVMLLRSDRPTTEVSLVSEPMLCLVASGSKRIVMGTQVFDFGPASSLVVNMAVPVTSCVVKANVIDPYLAVGFAIDPVVVAELLLMLPSRPCANTGTAVELQPVTLDLLQAAIHILRLLDRPADIPVLGPMRQRELLYRLLTGPHGAALQSLVQSPGTSARIASAAAWIRQHYNQPLRIAELARHVSLGEGSLHRNFKAVTGLSPLQYQKRIRLQEARSRLLSNAGDAATIGFSVGYNNPSQFSREYARQFGAPPGRDANRLRHAPEQPPW